MRPDASRMLPDPTPDASESDSDAPAEVMRDYVPKLKLRYNKKRSEGTIGSQASTGSVLMSLAGPRRG